MDPTGCFLDLLAAMHDEDFETARDYARALQDWLIAGGTYPQHFTVDEVDDYLATVLHRTARLVAVPNVGA